MIPSQILTKQERHKLYKDILEYVRRRGWGHVGFCYYLETFSGIDACFYMETYFPEIWKRRPDEYELGSYFFRTHDYEDEKRENILKLAIEETTPEKEE